MKDTIILIVVAVFVINAVVAISIFRWMKKKSERMARETEDSIMLAGEHAVVGPVSVFYCKPCLGRFGTIKGKGIAALTEKRLIVAPVTGSKMEISLADVADVKESKLYQMTRRIGRTHVVLSMKDGSELALVVKDPQPWLEGLQSIRPEARM